MERSATAVHGAVLVGLADAALEYAFGAEWINLERGRNAVLLDFLDASDEQGMTATEYRDNIYRGNLQSYADCLLVQRA